jgi:hypothetical protein
MQDEHYLNDDQQAEVCRQYGVALWPSAADQKIGISANVRSGVFPLNGLRILPEGDTTGWYIWAGEDLSSDPDFFLPLHASHMMDWCPKVYPYLGLPPGWRFLIAPGYEDVWYDPELVSAGGATS